VHFLKEVLSFLQQSFNFFMSFYFSYM